MVFKPCHDEQALQFGLLHGSPNLLSFNMALLNIIPLRINELLALACHAQLVAVTICTFN